MNMTDLFLIDNAIKYCDGGGEIRVTLRRGRKIVLTVENTYAAVGEITAYKKDDAHIGFKVVL